MATLAELPSDEFEGAIHLLLVGPSKTGKTRYIIELIKDGFTVLYVDNDNGLNTLRRGLVGNPEAMSRVHYIRTGNIWDWSVYFFARDRFQWNETQDKLFSPGSAQDDDKIVEIYRKRIPLGVVIVLDSWTSVCTQLMLDSAAKNSVPFETFNDKGQAVFGDAGRRANVMLMNIQSHPGHVIVQAHQDQYEILEKRKGAMKDVAKQAEMIVKDNQTIPLSVSRPHGFQMPKYFNEVGYLRINSLGKFILDFKQKPDRVGGGTPMDEGDPMDTMRFSRIFAKPRTIEGEWIRTVPAATFKKEAAEIAEANRLRAEEAKANKSSATTPAASGAKPLPAGGLLSSMKK